MKSSVKYFVKKVYLGLRGMYYIGKKYHCPICNRHFRKMLAGGFDLPIIKEHEIVGAGLRDNNICPYCQSTDRDRLIYLFLKDYSGMLQTKMKVLHIAPEPSLYNVLRKLDNILYFPGTKYMEGIYYQKNINIVDVLNLPYKNEEFDLVMCNHVLEHIPDDLKAMKELYRVLVPGGTAILQVPISYKLEKTFEDFSVVDPKEKEKYFGQFDHVRIYARDYADRLTAAGFNVRMTSPETEDWHIQQLDSYALNKKEQFYHITKTYDPANK